MNQDYRSEDRGEVIFLATPTYILRRCKIKQLRIFLIPSSPITSQYISQSLLYIVNLLGELLESARGTFPSALLVAALLPALPLPALLLLVPIAEPTIRTLLLALSAVLSALLSSALVFCFAHSVSSSFSPSY